MISYTDIFTCAADAATFWVVLDLESDVILKPCCGPGSLPAAIISLLLLIPLSSNHIKISYFRIKVTMIVLRAVTMIDMNS